MFNYNKEYSNEEIGSGIQRIQKSGCYITTIEKVGLLRTDKSRSEAFKFTFITEDQEMAKIDIFYQNKEGLEIKHNSKNLTHLVDLLKINPFSIQEAMGEDGKLHFPVLENKTIGIFLSFDGMESYEGSDGKEYERANYNLRGFFDPFTRRTIKEINDNVAASMYETWTKNFEKENSIRERKENEKSQFKRQNDDFKNKLEESGGEKTIDDDDFPF